MAQRPCSEDNTEGFERKPAIAKQQQSNEDCMQGIQEVDGTARHQAMPLQKCPEEDSAFLGSHWQSCIAAIIETRLSACLIAEILGAEILGGMPEALGLQGHRCVCRTPPVARTHSFQVFHTRPAGDALNNHVTDGAGGPDSCGEALACHESLLPPLNHRASI